MGFSSSLLLSSSEDLIGVTGVSGRECLSFVLLLQIDELLSTCMGAYKEIREINSRLNMIENTHAFITGIRKTYLKKKKNSYKISHIKIGNNKKMSRYNWMIK